VTNHKNRSEPILAGRLALFTSSESALRSIQLRRRKIKIAKTPVSPERTGAQRTRKIDHYNGNCKNTPASEGGRYTIKNYSTRWT
jgi:hypothetical protein